MIPKRASQSNFSRALYLNEQDAIELIKTWGLGITDHSASSYFKALLLNDTFIG